MKLFLKRGFEAVTIDEIADAADISKRSFFDYFPTKEDLVLAWQDKFAMAVTDALALRPAREPPAQALEQAMCESLFATATPQSFAITKLILETPALAARNQLKYAALETALADALRARDRKLDRVAARTFAMVAVGALRIGVEVWQETKGLTPNGLRPFTRKMMRRLWKDLAVLTEGAAAS
jgi:AcrR family transcriptional regulator